MAYALATVGLWAAWSLLGKVALRETTPLQATLAFAGVMAVCAVTWAAVSGRAAPWHTRGTTLALVSALCGALGMVTFSLALQHHDAAVVVPLMASYPAVVVLAARFIGEAPSGRQVVGVACTLAGAVLISRG